MDIASGNLESPVQGACVRYLRERDRTPLPPALFIVGDMTQPLYEQDNRYIRILAGLEPAPTPYLQQFAGLKMFDAVDIDKSGFIDYSEFVVASMNEKQLLTDEKLLSAFKMFDKVRYTRLFNNS